MKKKSIIGGILATSITLTAMLGGCSLISTNSNADMSQTVASVNISKVVENEFSEEYGKAVGTTEVIKREMVSYFINVGYTYMNNYGYDYEQTFNTIIDDLVENAVLTQYATMYILKDKGDDALAQFNEKTTEREKYEYLLDGENSADVKIAKYTLMYAMNAAIDSQERDILDEDSSSSGTETRDTPGNVNSEVENFFPAKTNGDGKFVDVDGNVVENADDAALDYNFYTGYNKYLLKNSGVYADDALEGTNRATRIEAYDEYISNYVTNNLIDAKTEDLSDIWNLKYVQEQYVNQLKQRVINKYYDLYGAAQEDALKGKDGEAYNYDYIKACYEDKLISQEEDYSSYQSASPFVSALGNMSDSSFILYAPDTSEIKTDNSGTFGFVYNILLPFNAMQSVALKDLQSKYADEKADGGYSPAYYTCRNNLLKNIKTTDQREAWFNGETEYAFDAAAAGIDYFGKDAGKSGWLFFENNLTKNGRYENLDKYYGKYSYNGSVVKDDDEYVLTPEKLSIDDMLQEFNDYIDYVLTGKSGASVTFDNGYNPATGNNDFYKTYDATNLYKKVDDEDVIDYQNFIYATGSVNFGSAWSRADVLNKSTVQYDVLSAVNELQYAYTTDTGVLSQYVGYSVNAVDTDYIKEFEFAAQQAVNKGAGNFTVCAGDYGWHIIYVTYTFDTNGGEQLSPQWNKERIETEGTFENIFYEWLKDKTISDVSTSRRKQIIAEYNTDETVTKYQKAYQDLLDMKN